MSKRKLYVLNKDDEMVFDLEYWQEYLKSCNLATLILIEVEADKSSEYRFCTHFSDFIDEGDCGKRQCTNYAPVNGKRGICKHKTFVFMPTDKTITIKKDKK